MSYSTLVWRSSQRGVRVALANCEAIFPAQDANKRMRDQAWLCRSRVVEEMQRRRGTHIAVYAILKPYRVGRVG
jgi:hypothetical protein